MRRNACILAAMCVAVRLLLEIRKWNEKHSQDMCYCDKTKLYKTRDHTNIAEVATA